MILLPEVKLLEDTSTVDSLLAGSLQALVHSFRPLLHSFLTCRTHVVGPLVVMLSPLLI